MHVGVARCPTGLLNCEKKAETITSRMLYQENIAPSYSPQKTESRLKLFKNNRLESAVRFKKPDNRSLECVVLLIFNQELKKRRIDVSTELRKVALNARLIV